jgi:hypothetical protein
LFFTRRKKKKKKKKKTKVNGKRQSAKAHSITTTTEYLSKRAHSVESVTVLDVYYHDDDDAPRRIYIHIYRYIYYYASWIEVDALWIVEGERRPLLRLLCVHTTFSQGLELTSAFMPR